MFFRSAGMKHQTVQSVISDIISSKRLQSLVPMNLLMNTLLLLH